MDCLRGHWGKVSSTGEFPFVDLVFMNIDGKPTFDGTDTCSYEFKFLYISPDYKYAKATAYIYNPAGFQGDYSNPRAVNLGADYTLEFNLININNGILYITVTGDYINGRGKFELLETVSDI